MPLDIGDWCVVSQRESWIVTLMTKYAFKVELSELRKLDVDNFRAYFGPVRTEQVLLIYVGNNLLEVRHAVP